MRSEGGTQTSAYDDRFFDEKQKGAFESARAIIPIVCQMIQPRSVIDFGCGRGVWLRVFQEFGVEVVKGLDGAYVDQSRLAIDQVLFSPVDLREPIQLSERYDLAVCLEVAEHLPVQYSKKLISELTAAAPIVLFSAAIPGQDGVDHVNEQWPDFWESLFREHGYLKSDCIRRGVMFDRKIDWWYRQNICLFFSSSELERFSVLHDEVLAEANSSMEWVHIKILARSINRYSTTSKLWHELVLSLRNALLRRIKRQVRWF